MTTSEVAQSDRLTSSTEPGVTVTGLTVVTDRQSTPVVDDISFSVPRGSVLGLVGESGSGKSTVGVALLGLARKGLRIACGAVEVGGLNLLRLSQSELRHARGRLVSYVPQDPTSGLNPALRVGSQLRETLNIHHDALADGQSADSRVHEVLEEVGLPPTDKLLRSFPHQLSGGQQQRVGIAMAFACRPRLIVLDEPTTGLDVTTQHRVLDTVRGLTQRHEVTSIYVSHDLAVVAQIADVTAVMYAGRIVEMGPTKPVFMSPRHHYTGGLLKAAPSATTTSVLTGINGRPPSPGRWPQGCAFATRCDSRQSDCEEVLPGLEDMGPSHQARCLHPLSISVAPESRAPAPQPRRHSGRALSVRGLVGHYGGIEVLHGVDLDVEPGRCTAVVGESGSGKTTFARCLVGLHENWTGTVRYGDDELATSPLARTVEQRRLIQYVFQNPFASLNPRMTVRQNIEEPLRFFTKLRAANRGNKVFEILEDVALSAEYADRMPDQLSGGERQRVAVGRALVVDPELIVCDEVTSALDVSVQALLVEQLRKLQLSRGLSMVFITHNLAVVRSIAQDVIVLAGGEVVEHGPVGEVLDNPRHEYTHRLLADLPHIEAARTASAG